MSAAPWTPGPWFIAGRGYTVFGSDGEVVTSSFDAETDEEEARYIANARLIAAAPEMAKLLHEARTWMELANSPDDEHQTKEQYRLMFLDLAGDLLSRIRGEA